MKRVLNSGAIRLPGILIESNDVFRFMFEIKAPLVVLSAFRDANLGTLKRLAEQDHPIAYLPPTFYTKDGIEMTPQQLNIYTTKLFNFYNASFNFHKKLIDDGMNPTQADMILPQGMFINFLWEITPTDLVKYITEHYNDSPEIFGYCSVLVIYLEEHYPLKVSALRHNEWKDKGL